MSRSRASVVVGPCPGSTSVSSGSGNTWDASTASACRSRRRAGRFVRSSRRRAGRPRTRPPPRAGESSSDRGCDPGCEVPRRPSPARSRRWSPGQRFVVIRRCKRRRSILIHRDPEEHAELIGGVQCHEVVVGMDVGGYAGGTHYSPGATGVVDVTVGHQQRNGSQVVLRQDGADPCRVGRGVDHHCRPAGLGGNDVAIGLGQPERTGIDEECGAQDESAGLWHESVCIKYAIDRPQVGDGTLEQLGVGEFHLVAQHRNSVASCRR